MLVTERRDGNKMSDDETETRKSGRKPKKYEEGNRSPSNQQERSQFYNLREKIVQESLRICSGKTTSIVDLRMLCKQYQSFLSSSDSTE